MQQVIVHKGRTTTLPVSLGYDVSADTITSQIREEGFQTSPIIAEWDVAFLTDGTDGELVLTLDDAITGAITKATGFMDLKRVTGTEPVNVFDEMIPVSFRGTVTV